MNGRIRSLTAVTAVTAGLLAGVVTGTASAAQEQKFVGGTPSTNKLVNKGFGTASADAQAKANGALTANASATGGGSLPLLPIGATGAFGYAQTARAIDVAPGTYRVTFTYENTKTQVNEVRGGQSAPQVDSIAQFVCEHGCHGQHSHPVVRFDEVQPGTATLSKTLRISVPAGEDGYLLVTGRVLADANATKKGATAKSSVTTNRTVFRVTEI